MKAKNIADLLKTAAIYLLTASMLVSAGLYINAMQNAGQGADIPWEKMRIFKIGGMALSEIDESHMTPLQITITANRKTFTATYNDKSVSDIYEHGIKSSIRDIFGKNSECRLLGEKDGEELWGSCAGLDKSVYVKYAGNYIYPFIYTFLDKDWDIKNSANDFSGELAMVHELFIIEDGEVLGVAKDIYGRVSVFSPAPELKSKIRQCLASADLSAYENIAGTVPCDFLKGGEINAQPGVGENGINNLKFPENFHLFRNYDQYSFVLEFSNPLAGGGNEIGADQAYIKNLFKILNFNIDNSASHPEGDGTTFRDGKNTVRFYGDGSIVYSSNENSGGIHLAKFLSYDDSYYTYYEKIKAASVFVGSLDRELAGNECRIYLTNVSVDSNGDMNVIFSYCYEGAEIKINGSSEAVALTVNENSFSKIKINSLNISLSHQGMVKNRNPIFDLKMIDREISKRQKDDVIRDYKLAYDENSGKFIVGDFRLIYKVDYASGEGNIAKAEWELS